MEGQNHRMVLFHQLSFETEKLASLKQFYRSMEAKYNSKIGSLFFSAEKLAKKLAQKEYEVKVSEESSFSSTPGGLVQASIELLTQFSTESDAVDPHATFLAGRDSMLNALEADLREAGVLDQVDGITLMLRADFDFVTNHLSKLFSDSDEEAADMG